MSSLAYLLGAYAVLFVGAWLSTCNVIRLYATKLEEDFADLADRVL